MDQSIHDRTICRCDPINEGLSYIKDSLYGGPYVRLGFFLMYLYKGI